MSKPKSVGKFVEPKTLMPAWKGGKLIIPGRPQNVGTYTPDPFPPLDASVKPMAITLSAVDANEESTSLIVNQTGKRAVISYLKAGRNGTTRLIMCDLEAGQVLDSYTVPTSAIPLALADDGEHLAVKFLPEAGAGDESHMEVWAWTDKGITREVRFLPHDDSVQFNERFTFARFIGDSQLAMLTSLKQLMIFEWKTAKLLFIFDKYDLTNDISVSANHKYLFAAARNTSLAIIDTSNFEFSGYYSPRNWTHDFRLSPSGTQVITASYDGVNRTGESFAVTIPEDRTTSFFQVTQLGLGRLLGFPSDQFALFESVERKPEPAKPDSTGKTPKATKTPKVPATKKGTTATAKKGAPSVGSIVIHEIDEETREDLGFATYRIDSSKVSTGKVALVDLQNRVRAWEYTGVDRLTNVGPRCWCLTKPDKGKPASLVPLAIPGQELVDQVTKLVAEPEYFLLKDGGTVKVNLSSLKPADREAGLPVVEKQLKERNITIGDTSDLELVAKVGPYRIVNVTSLAQVGNQALIGEHTHRQLTMDVTLLLKGQPVYSTVLVKSVSLIDKQPNESSQQYLDRNPGTPVEILGRLNIPKVIFGPNGNKPLGTTNLTDPPSDQGASAP